MERAARTHLGNAVALVGAIAMALWLGWERPDPVTLAATPSPKTSRVPLAAGGFGIADKSGQVMPLRRFGRIVSSSWLADGLLAELAEPTRVLAVSNAADRTAYRWRHEGKARIDAFGSMEALVALGPDLVLMNGFLADARVTKLREAGVPVFDLGDMRGLPSLSGAAITLGELLGDPDRGRRFAETFSARMRRIAASIPPAARRPALYLAVYAGKIFGGTRGTSYHDVMTHAGLVDVAAGAGFVDWPEYRVEDVLRMDPELVVSKDGMLGPICGHAGLRALGACLHKRIVMLPEAMLDDPGVGMLPAAERLHELAYPER